MKALAKTVVALLVLLGLTVPSFSQVAKKTPGDEKAAMGKAKKDSMQGKMKEPMEKQAKPHDMKGQMKGQIVLSLEGTGSRLHRLAGTALYDEPFLSVDEMMRRVEAVTLSDVAELAAEYFEPDQQVVVRLGPEN